MTKKAVSGESFVFAAMMDFETNPQRPQHIASRLARANHVLYLESPFSLVGLLRNNFGEFSKLLRYFKGVRPRSPSLAMWTPPPNFHPFDKVLWVSRLYARLVARGTSRALKRLHWAETPIIYAMHPWSAWIGASLPHKVLVLDWYAPWVEHWAHLLLKKRIWKPIVKVNYWLKKRAAVRALARADMILCGARLYQETAKTWGYQGLYLPNGAEMSMWKDASADLRPLPDDIAAVSGPRIGVICARIHRDLVDFDLILGVAQERPEWSWILIGQPIGDVQRLRALPNIRLLGHKPYRDLPRYIAGFDLCAIPYLLRTTTQSGIPVKLLEYLPSGKPVITYPTPEVRSDPALRGLFHYASTAREFIAAAETALKEDPRDLRNIRRSFIRQYDWDSLADVLSHELEGRIHEQGARGKRSCGKG
jgi:glycosyltransferase involved in cell wall biosynthesis